MNFYKLSVYRELGFKKSAQLIKSALFNNLVLYFFGLPGIKQWLMAKVDKKVFAEHDYTTRTAARLYIPRIKMTYRITRTSLKTSKAWVERHFGK